MKYLIERFWPKKAASFTKEQEARIREIIHESLLSAITQTPVVGSQQPEPGERQQIYEGLKKHYGSQKRLANEQGVTREWVRMVLNGEQEDGELLLAAAKLWHQLEKERVMKLEEAAQYADMAAALALT